jgi:hypothetical protein
MNIRHLRAWVSTIIVVAAVLLSVVLANLIGARTSTRFDLSFTGTHKLSPRTAQLLDRLPPGYQIVLAVDRAGVDQRAYDAVVDLLTNMADSSPSLGLRIVDVGQPRQRAQFEQLVADLRERDRPLVAQQAQQLEKAAAEFTQAASTLRQTQAELESLAQAVPVERSDARDIREFFTQRSDLTGLLADQLELLADAVRTGIAPVAGTLPDTATMRDRVLPELEKIDTQLAPVVSQFGRFASTQAMPETHKPASARLGRTLAGVRDALRIEADALSRFERASVFRVASALEQGEACLIIGPPEAGLTGIDRDTLIPSAAGLGAAGVRAPTEIARRAEDLVSIALSSLASHDRPILVMLHAEVEPFVMSTPAFEQFIERNRLRGVDVVEWSLLTHPEPPALEPIDPGGTRPVVYFVIAPNSAAASVAGNEDLAGARRAAKLGVTLAALLDNGASAMVCVNPSVFPTFGDIDPIAATLEPFGLRALTGSPLVFERLEGNGQRRTLTAVDAVGVQNDNTLSQAIASLSARLIWPIVIDVQPVQGIETNAVLEVEGGTDRWLESQWIGLWQAASGSGGVTATYDPARDVRRDQYIVARSAERTQDGTPRPQRVLCIGSNAWALDRVAQARATVDGRLIPLHPGNLELIDASVFWLAGQDAMIARGASTASAPTVSAIEPAMRTRLEWGLIAGLPLGVLVLGVGYRIIRG